jgi:hypothetical protein
MKIDLNEIQLDFLLTACNLHWAVWQFDITNKDFEKDYGYTKDEAQKAILELKRQLREL